jgi:UDP-N-acetylmuramate dehydrogenase
MALIDRLAPVRGKLLADEALAPFTWFRVGGPAEVLFLPADREDLQDFLINKPADVPVSVLGVGSNVIVRDGGAPGVVVRLAGREWGKIAPVSDTTLEVWAGALDARVAHAAAQNGLSGLEFLVGIPGTIGGALRMNAGCYDREIQDVLVVAFGLTHAGQPVEFWRDQIGFSYRHSDFPEDVILTHCVLAASGRALEPEITARMADITARREAAQPIRERTGGSTFANPDPPGTPNQRKAWVLIDQAGMRGARRGGAMVSEKHCNFLINVENATAADIEGLGEEVRAKVLETSGVLLQWEIKRLGKSA